MDILGGSGGHLIHAKRLPNYQWIDRSQVYGGDLVHAKRPPSVRVDQDEVSRWTRIGS